MYLDLINLYSLMFHSLDRYVSIQKYENDAVCSDSGPTSILTLCEVEVTGIAGKHQIQTMSSSLMCAAICSTNSTCIAYSMIRYSNDENAECDLIHISVLATNQTQPMRISFAKYFKDNGSPSDRYIKTSILHQF